MLLQTIQTCMQLTGSSLLSPSNRPTRGRMLLNLGSISISSGVQARLCVPGDLLVSVQLGQQYCSASSAWTVPDDCCHTYHTAWTHSATCPDLPAPFIRGSLSVEVYLYNLYGLAMLADKIWTSDLFFENCFSWTLTRFTTILYDTKRWNNGRCWVWECKSAKREQCLLTSILSQLITVWDLSVRSGQCTHSLYSEIFDKCD